MLSPERDPPRDPVRERDFYRRLLELNSELELEPLLDQALALIVEVSGATAAYLELYDDNGGEPQFWRGYHVTDVDLETIRASISHGIIAKALAEGRAIETPSALSDPRFADLRSVQRHAIEAVLCVPLGAPAIGVIYLQGPRELSPVDRDNAELFARQLAPLAARLLAARPQRAAVDYTTEVRARIRAPQLIGRSKAMAKMLHAASLVAPLDIDVLITGPSGTGKSTLARAIVDNGARAGQPFVELNCANFQDTLVEGELFGAEKGSHSAAHKKILGKVAAAEGGTLFLDEIGELSMNAQSKLLQLLQERVYHPLGSTAAVRADVRIITATNANLRAAVAQKKFREDLYYRVHVLPLELPGLSERRDDIPDLVEHFTAEVCHKHHMPPLAVSIRASNACREADWPGHVRQLRNMIEAAVIRANGDQSKTLQEHHIFVTVSPSEQADAPITFHDGTRHFQQRLVREALERNNWNAASAAKDLDLARSYVYNLIHEFGLERAKSPGGGKR